MTKILILAGILVALKVLQPVLRVLIAAVAAKPVGRRALEKQPDTIHLTPADQSAWKDRAAVGPTGLGQRPGHPITNLPNLSVEQMFEKATAGRPPGVFAPHGAEAAARDFENAWAESMAWRKGNGISTGEVVNVAIRRKSA